MNSSTPTIAEQVDGLLDVAAPAARLGDDALRVELVACEQAAQMLLARQGQMMVEMGTRARAADQTEIAERGKPMWSQQCQETFVPDEIAVLLTCTKMAASVKYAAAVYAAQYRSVGTAWRAGQVDARKVAVIGEQVGYLDPATAEQIATAAAEYATGQGGPAGTPLDGGRTAPQLREWLRREVIAADPDAAERRRQRAFADRRVVITAGDDGMSELWALLPSVQAHQIQQTLTAAAQDGGADDARTMDQRRVDGLVDLLLGRTDPPEVNVEVIVAADTLTGQSREPGWVPGVGPVTAEQVGELIGAAPGGSGHVSFRRLLTDPTTGVLTDVAERRYRPSAALDRAVRARDVTCRFPGCRRSADSAGTDLDHTIPWPVGPTAATNLSVLCRRHHRLKHTAGWTVALDHAGVMTWTTPTGRRYTTHPWQYKDPHPPPLE